MRWHRGNLRFSLDTRDLVNWYYPSFVWFFDKLNYHFLIDQFDPRGDGDKLGSVLEDYLIGQEVSFAAGNSTTFLYTSS